MTKFFLLITVLLLVILSNCQISSEFVRETINSVANENNIICSDEFSKSDVNQLIKAFNLDTVALVKNGKIDLRKL